MQGISRIEALQNLTVLAYESIKAYILRKTMKSAYRIVVIRHLLQGQRGSVSVIAVNPDARGRVTHPQTVRLRSFDS